MGAARCIRVARAAAVALAALGGCEKVPLLDINASFSRADAVWFEEEETLFFFYRVDAEQGLGAQTQMELTWRTDDEEQPWAPVDSLPPVHVHEPVDCGTRGFCGSTSLRVRGLPREVGLRLRYHREGAMTLDPETQLHVIGRGPPHTHRSLTVYGVFDEHNERVQWRARHRFPNLRNHEVQDLGLRRQFVLSDPGFTDVGPVPPDNPYGYGSSPQCPAMTPLGWPEVGTWERAVFDPHPMPVAASASDAVCALATVADAAGTFTTPALARKNPEVMPAFPALRSPVKVNTQVGFVLRPCRRVISEPHLSMQIQRMLLEGAPEICIDDWDEAGFAAQLASRFRGALDTVRLQGNDMVLVLALHHDDRSGRVGAVLEEALALVMPFERDKSSPRASGALVFDSFEYTMKNAEMDRIVLWCPPHQKVDDLDSAPFGPHRCPIQPDQPELTLGSFRFGNLPILASRPQYLTFIGKYSVAQAGRMTALTFRAPERTPLSQNVPVGDFGVATFFNGERITPAATDAFSFCAPEDGGFVPVVFRVAVVPDILPLELLPQIHAEFPQPAYELGLFWEFPYLLRLEYEVVVAGAASAYGLTVPFGIRDPSEAFYGLRAWEAGEFPLHERLLQCRQFCTHPTFDSAGVYNVLAPFDETYQNQCYRPRYPRPGDGGFPLDP